MSLSCPQCPLKVSALAVASSLELAIEAAAMASSRMVITLEDVPEGRSTAKAANQGARFQRARRPEGRTVQTL